MSGEQRLRDQQATAESVPGLQVRIAPGLQGGGGNHVATLVAPEKILRCKGNLWMVSDGEKNVGSLAA